MVALVADEAPLRKVRLTGGEPLLLPWLPDLVSGLRAMLPHATLAMTTNGVRLPERAEILRRRGLDRLNISLDAAEEEAFERVAGRPGLDKVLDGIQAARRAGFQGTKLNTVMLRGVNEDQLVKICRLAAEQQLEARFIELMPMGAGEALHQEQFLGAAEAMERLRDQLQHVRHLGRQGAADRHLMRDGVRLVTVGLISPISSPFCDSCDRVRLDPAGQLLGCLRREQGVDLLGALRGTMTGGDLELARRQVRRLVLGKGRAGGSWPRRSMSSIGG
jgi:GTP 3',8-cyclase